MNIITGTDTYGRVKVVAGTPVVTQFSMFQMLPIYPTQSLYLIRIGASEFRGVPLIASSTTTQIHGVPLAKIDRASVVMAYLRAPCAVLVICGFIALVMGAITAAQPQGMQADQKMILLGGAIAFVVGAGLAGFSYWYPLVTPRERLIRVYCRELLGIAIDPAQVTTDVSQALVEQTCATSSDSLSAREQFLRDLVIVRATLANGGDTKRLEARTDDLLGKLRQTNAVPRSLKQKT